MKFDNLLPTDWAYLAGFYDGEGAMSTTRQVRNGHSYFQVKFVITNTEFHLLASLQAQFGGVVYTHKTLAEAHHKRMHQWHMSAQADILPVLAGMLPYLRYKRKEVELAQEFFSSSYMTLPGKVMTMKERTRRYKIVKAIRAIPGRRCGFGRKVTEPPIRSLYIVFCHRCSKKFKRKTGNAVYCSALCRGLVRQAQYEAYNTSRNIRRRQK